MDAALQPHTPSLTPLHQARPDDDFGKVYEALSIAGIVGIAGIARESLPNAASQSSAAAAAAWRWLLIN